MLNLTGDRPICVGRLLSRGLDQFIGKLDGHAHKTPPVDKVAPIVFAELSTSELVHDVQQTAFGPVSAVRERSICSAAEAVKQHHFVVSTFRATASAPCLERSSFSVAATLTNVLRRSAIRSGVPALLIEYLNCATSMRAQDSKDVPLP